jgi:hypothetical protein
METSEFRRVFDTLARTSGFAPARASNWVRENAETIVAINLQRSNYGRLYYVNFKVWLQGFAGRTFVVNDDLLREPGHIFRRAPQEFSTALDLESDLTQQARLASLEELFDRSLVPLSAVFETREQICRFAREHPDEIFLLPAIREYLGV